jgi:hypothetical protein
VLFSIAQESVTLPHTLLPTAATRGPGPAAN